MLRRAKNTEDKQVNQNISILSCQVLVYIDRLVFTSEGQRWVKVKCSDVHMSVKMSCSS